jgi:peptidoglycan/LPS O-acetylase OafA/YrhL
MEELKQMLQAMSSQLLALEVRLNSVEGSGKPKSNRGESQPVDARYRESIPFSPGFTAGNVLSHLALVHNWSRDWRWAFDPPLWSIALEVQIYFAFALLLLPVWRRFGSMATFGAAIGMAIVVILAGAGFTSPWMVILFVMGMAAATVGTTGAGGPSRTYRALAGGLVVAVPLVTMLRNKPDDMVSDLTVGAATACALIVMSQVSVRGGTGGFVQRLLSSPIARALGLISFSLYLVHYPVVRVIGSHWQGHMNLAGEDLFLFLCLVGIPASLLVAVVFYRFVERRFLNYRPEPIRASSATPVTPALGRPGGASS